VDFVAWLSEDTVGSVVAWVTVSPVTVDFGVAVGITGDVCSGVTAMVVRGDSAEDSQGISPLIPCAFPRLVSKALLLSFTLVSPVRSWLLLRGAAALAFHP
jgi:hypothetical protein